MFCTDLLSIIRSLNTVFSAIGICHTSNENTVLRLLMMDSKSVQNMEFFTKIEMRNSASSWLLL